MEIPIEKVRNHPCLLDMSSVLYRDIGRKDLTWETVAKECGISNAKEAKSQWKRLRDSHREALRRRKTSTGQAAKKIQPWKYEQLMEFLLPQNHNGDTFSNYSNENTRENIPPDDIESGATTPKVSFRDTIPHTTKRKNTSIVDILEERENKRECRERERDELRRQVFDRMRTHDALSDLFSSMCQKTRQLPKHLQLRVQREIFDSVTHAEEEALSFKSTSNPEPTFYGHSPEADRYSQNSSPGTSVEPERASQPKKKLTLLSCNIFSPPDERYQ